MKKLLLILLCLPMIGFGQDKSVWINAGIGISNNVEGSDFPDFIDEDKFISPFLALNLLLQLNENFNLDFIISYNQNKIKSQYVNFTLINGSGTNDIGGTAIENTISYLSINPNLEFKLFKNLLINKTSFSIGPFLSFAINNDRKYLISNNYFNIQTQNIFGLDYVDLDVMEEEEVKKVDFGVKIGLSYSLTNRLKIVTEYKLGLTDLNHLNTYENRSVKSGTINCSLAYRL